MILKYFMVLSIIALVIGEESDDYLDALINLMMNGDAVDYELDIHDDTEPTLIGDIWQCGNCDEIDDSKIVYSEVNTVENTFNDVPVEIQVGVAVPTMRCVTVKTDLRESSVRRTSGACSGGAVTLTIAPPQHFIVNAYS